MLNVRRISSFIEKHQIDIAHAHVARDYMAASIAVRKAKNTKLVLTRHAASPLKPFYRFAIGNLETAIAVSPLIHEQLVRVFPPEKVRLIVNGLDIGAITNDNGASGREFRRLIEISDDVPLVAAAGELTLHKGQRDLVLAANEVIKRVPNCHFVIVGEDTSIDQHFRRELKRLVKVLGLDKQFSWLNDLDDISPLVAAADILVSPAHSDTLGLTILDAMAAGKAVIATETDGARELISHPGALTPVKDPVGLADRICWYLENDDERRKLGADLRAAAVEKFGMQEMADATERVYLDVLNGR
jgi:glycosyltransferase involved in cell wall biosynthesis